MRRRTTAGRLARARGNLWTKPGEDASPSSADCEAIPPAALLAAREFDPSKHPRRLTSRGNARAEVFFAVAPAARAPTAALAPGRTPRPTQTAARVAQASD